MSAVVKMICNCCPNIRSTIAVWFLIAEAHYLSPTVSNLTHRQGVGWGLGWKRPPPPSPPPHGLMLIFCFGGLGNARVKWSY